MKWDWIDINTIEINQDSILVKDTGECFKRSDFISKNREEKTKKLRLELDQKRSLCAEFLLNRMLQKEYPDMATPVLIGYGNQNGKPFLVEHKDIYFNLSHSGDYVVCAIHNKEVGIDIEQLGRMKEKTANRFFHDDERKELDNCKEVSEKQKRLLTYWTLKESYMKATGMGLKIPLNSFVVKIVQTKDNQMATFEKEGKSLDYKADIIEFNTGYSIAVCAKK